MIEEVRRWKWTWAEHVSRVQDNRWTSRIARNAYETEIPRGLERREWQE